MVKDSNGNPLKDAVVKVQGISKNMAVSTSGEFWRVLEPGTYMVSVEADGWVYFTVLYGSLIKAPSTEIN